MINWPDIFDLSEKDDTHSILVTVGAAHGSTPRETGSNMLVTEKQVIGTIGGGQLEYLAIDRARTLLGSKTEKTEILSLPLGPELAQCCGGHVDVLLYRLTEEDAPWISAIKEVYQNNKRAVLLSNWGNGAVSRAVLCDNFEIDEIDEVLLSEITNCFENGRTGLHFPSKGALSFTMIEPLNIAQFHLTIFGAGHVGKAVVHTLSQLPCSIHWVDERAEMFPMSLPHNVKKIVAKNPQLHVKDAPASSYYLVMSHSHQLDLDLCAEILARGDSAYLGLIGSQTKRKKFEKRLRMQGLSDVKLGHMTCPIGLPHLQGKHPAQIAISVSADILNRVQTANQIFEDHKSQVAYS